jgi:glycerophosphoryl diester phosphodiesterase
VTRGVRAGFVRRALLPCGLAIACGASTAAGFDLQGHRGARGLAPENTMAAFRKALAIGVTTIEADLAVTRDDIVVIAHDRDLDPSFVRDAGGRWLAERGPPIRTLTLAELRRYDVGRLDPASAYAKQFPLQVPSDGERVATLDELLALVAPTNVRLDLETKIAPTSGDATADPQTFVRLVVERLHAAGMGARTTLQSFDWRTLAVAKRVAPDIETACLTSDETMKPDASGRSPWHAGLALADHGGSIPRLVRAAGCATWSAQWQTVTRERVDEAHALGLRVLAWTVNARDDMRRLIDIGVDGLITDYPDRLAALLDERGIRWR